MVQMEVCANSLSSAIEAERGGACRVELCDNLPEGGTTPSYAQIKLAKERLKIQVYPIIRPRGGDFLYDDLEFEIMKTDIKLCKQLKCDGVVFGILNKEGSIDKRRCAVLMELAGSMPVTFHRAFDSSRDLYEALEVIIDLGCERILTSGGAPTAQLGIDTIKGLITAADSRIKIMPGTGVNEHNIAEIIRISGAKEFHASAKKPVATNMTYSNTKVTMGSFESDINYDLTDRTLVRNLLLRANSI